MPINLTPFCSSDETRYYVHAPLVRGEWLYATDGRIIVRVPAKDFPEYKAPVPGESEQDANAFKYALLAARLFDTLPLDWEKTAQWTRLVSVEIPPRRFEKCEECGGEPPGCFECENGKVQKFDYVKIGKKMFSNHYLALMVEHLPNVTIAASVGTEREQAPFEFDGGSGLVMPCSVGLTDSGGGA